MLIKYSGKYVKIYFNMKIAYYFLFILFVKYVRVFYICPGVGNPYWSGISFPPFSRCSDRLRT